MKKILTLTLSLMLGIAAFAQGPFPTFTTRVAGPGVGQPQMGGNH